MQTGTGTRQVEENSTKNSLFLTDPSMPQGIEIHITPKSQVARTVTVCLRHLAPKQKLGDLDNNKNGNVVFEDSDDDDDACKNGEQLEDENVLANRIVTLKADTNNVSKGVTIAEIVKRRLGEGNIKWWQYNKVEKRAVAEESMVEGTERENIISKTVSSRDDGVPQFSSSTASATNTNENSSKINTKPVLSVKLASYKLDESQLGKGWSMQSYTQKQML